MTKRKQIELTFNSMKLASGLQLYQGRTKNSIFMVWFFPSGSIDYDVGGITAPLVYSGSFPLPLHYRIIAHFNLKAEIERRRK